MKLVATPRPEWKLWKSIVGPLIVALRPPAHSTWATLRPARSADWAIVSTWRTFGSKAAVRLPNGCPEMWNVLFVERVDARPRAGGQRVPAGARVRGRLRAQAVAGGEGAVAEESAHRREQAVTHVLLDRVLAEPVRCEEHGLVAGRRRRRCGDRRGASQLRQDQKGGADQHQETTGRSGHGGTSATRSISRAVGRGHASHRARATTRLGRSPYRDVNGTRRTRLQIVARVHRKSRGERPRADSRRMSIHPAVAERLARLAPDQRTAATAPPGPVLVVAPAGSGKTTTLVARVAWLVASGVAPDAVAAITFNRRAAVELSERVDAALAPLGIEAGAVRVRTFHALGLEILRDAGAPMGELVDRAAVLARSRAVGRRDGAGRAGRRRLAPEGRARRDRRRGRRRSRRRPDRPGLRRLRGCRLGSGRARLRRPRPPGDRAARERPCPARSLARAVRPPARRRGPGRRPGATPARAPPGRAGQPDPARRRRRPVHLRLAPGRRPQGPGPRRGPARPRPGRP